MNLCELEESMTTAASSASLATTAGGPAAGGAAGASLKPSPGLHLVSSHISLEDRTKLEEERERLYSLLDSKVKRPV